VNNKWPILAFVLFLFLNSCAFNAPYARKEKPCEERIIMYFNKIDIPFKYEIVDTIFSFQKHHEDAIKEMESKTCKFHKDARGLLWVGQVQLNQLRERSWVFMAYILK